MGLTNYSILGTAFVLILEQSGKGHSAFGKGHGRVQAPGFLPRFAFATDRLCVFGHGAWLP